MVKLLETPIWIEEEAPPLDISMPRVFRQPARTGWTRGRVSVRSLIQEAQRAQDRRDLGQVYGKLLVEFQPAVQWVLDSWEFLLTTEGCRFLLRSIDEKRYCRGDYRAFTDKDFQRFVHRIFKEYLLRFLEGRTCTGFIKALKQNFWPSVRAAYRALENPPDPTQRRLTAYSYLRCVPYQFLNLHHQERVYRILERLTFRQRQAIDLYYLRFHTVEAALEKIQVPLEEFQQRLMRALQSVGERDGLSHQLLLQIERY